MRFFLISLSLMTFCLASQAQLAIHDSVPADLRHKIKEGVRIVGQMHWSEESESHNAFFGPSEGGEVYFDFIDSMAGIFFADHDEESFFAYALPGYNIVYFTSLTRDSSVPPIELFYAILHEVHHFGDLLISHRHVACPAEDLLGDPLVHSVTGESYEGLSSCDDYGDGAYGLGVIMMGQIVNYCTNCSEQTIEEARELGKKLLRRIIDPPTFFRYLEEYNF